MSVFNTALSPAQSVSISGASTPQITNQLLSSANTEYLLAIPAGTRQFQLKARGVGKLQFGTTIGSSSSTFITIWPGAVYSELNLDPSNPSINLYVQSSVDGETIELISWT